MEAIIRHLFTVDDTSFIGLSLKLIFLETALCIYIIGNIKYTEIDWSTYIQQVECFRHGTWNYSQIEGDTGPVVYPAGHIYSYLLLYQLTEKGLNIIRAQYLFALFYMMTLMLVFRLYFLAKKVPPFVLFFLTCTSYRVHSIFLLRLFNDPIAMLLFYIALNFWVSQKWLSGAIFYSLAVSVKMNVLLFAPAVFFVLILNNGFRRTIQLLFLCGNIQVLLALPFLLADPVAYVKRSFDLGRIFLFKWTVNWRFLPEEIFLSRKFHIGLLGIHVLLLLVFALACWFRRRGGLLFLLRRMPLNPKTMKTHDILYAVFTANLIGVSVARSLHYQFYCWYFHSLPYLLFSTLKYKRSKSKSSGIKDIPYFSIVLRCALLVAIESCWNTYPSTVRSSLCLQLIHVIVIAMMFKYGISCRAKKTKTA